MHRAHPARVALASAFVLVCLLACVARAQEAPDGISILPQSIFVNKSTVNATIALYPVTPFTQVFLQYRDYGKNCSDPASIANEYTRTHVHTLDLDRKFNFPVWKLRPGLYLVCHRNSTTPAPGYTGFKPLHKMVTITRYDECTGGKFGVCKVNPATISGRVGNTTVQIYYVLPGKQAFIMKPKRFGVPLYNCTNPPPTESGMRSPVATTQFNAKVTFETFGLEAGTYIVCYKDSTTFQRLDPTVVVSGPIDAARSTVSCCGGPYQVGQRAYCQINTVDSMGNPAGGRADACELRVCPLTDGRGDAITDYVEPYFVDVGLFEFHFVARGSGCGASASASYKGNVLGGNKVNFFTLLPSTIDPTQATSDCSWADGVTKCNVTRRDTYGNPISTCHVTSTGSLYCKPTVQA